VKGSPLSAAARASVNGGPVTAGRRADAEVRLYANNTDRHGLTRTVTDGRTDDGTGPPHQVGVGTDPYRRWCGGA